jgi:hypothetical protein
VRLSAGGWACVTEDNSMAINKRTGKGRKFMSSGSNKILLFKKNLRNQSVAYIFATIQLRKK